MAFSVLVVDDDIELGSYVKEYLEAKQMDVHVCTRGELALAYLGTHLPNMCVLDVRMPMMDGFTLAEQIKELHPDLPFLFLTGQVSKDERIRGLRLGADDYISKPFSLEELFLRIQNVLKRTPANVEEKESSALELGVFSFDPVYQQLSHKSGMVKLSDIENKLLSLLLESLNQTVDRHLIMQEIWGEVDEYKGKSLNVYVTKLRKKLALEKRIELVNLHGKGYKLVYKSTR